jgi:hypothetical protein
MMLRWVTSWICAKCGAFRVGRREDVDRRAAGAVARGRPGPPDPAGRSVNRLFVVVESVESVPLSLLERAPAVTRRRKGRPTS